MGQKAEAVATDKKVNVAMTQHDSIFPNIKLPGGISSKATEYKELGQKGDTWHSPIFKLGSASASTDVPKAPNVTRKEHSVPSGGVRGPQNVGNTGSTTNQLMIHLLKLLERPLALRSETKLIRHSIHLRTAAVSTAPASTAPLPMVTATPMERSPMVTPLSARTTQSFPEASNWLVCVGSGLAVLYFMRI